MSLSSSSSSSFPSYNPQTDIPTTDHPTEGAKGPKKGEHAGLKRSHGKISEEDSQPTTKIGQVIIQKKENETEVCDPRPRQKRQKTEPNTKSNSEAPTSPQNSLNTAISHASQSSFLITSTSTSSSIQKEKEEFTKENSKKEKVEKQFDEMDVKIKHDKTDKIVKLKNDWIARKEANSSLCLESLDELASALQVNEHLSFEERMGNLELLFSPEVQNDESSADILWVTIKANPDNPEQATHIKLYLFKQPYFSYAIDESAFKNKSEKGSKHKEQQYYYIQAFESVGESGQIDSNARPLELYPQESEEGTAKNEPQEKSEAYGGTSYTKPLLQMRLSKKHGEYHGLKKANMLQGTKYQNYLKSWITP